MGQESSLFMGMLYSRGCNSADFWLMMAVEKVGLACVMPPGGRLKTGK
jgi:hypothetical protein